ncbi:MAG: serine hydrolase [Acidobacteria bacterium]|nr:serine hydrolase [Acidobacteriota bacterium]
MRKLFLFLLATIVLQGADPDVKALVEAARNAWAVPGVAVAIVKDDKPLYLAGHGLREAGKTDPVTPHTAFQIASTTKAFTTAAMAMLVDEGKIAWDDPVRKHLNFFRLADPHADALVTARDLVTHRTGLPRHDVLWVRTGLGREELIRRIGLAKPAAQFRGVYQYQNLMFTSAGELVGRVSGLGWDRFVQQRILLPLGMKDTSTAYADMLRHTNMAMPHIKGKANPLQNYDNIGGAGSIASSVDDLSRWVRMQLAGGIYEGTRLVSEKQLQATHEPQMVIQRTAASREMQPEYTQSSYAMGWFVNHYRGEMLVMHSGSLSGYRALITMVPRLKMGIVILANENGTNLNEALTNTLLDEYLGLPKTRDWNAYMLGVVKANDEKEAREKREAEEARKKDTKPSLPLNSYVGIYREAAYGDVKVSLQQGKLHAEWMRFRGDMDHWQYDTWKIKADGSLKDAIANFQLDEKGSPVRLLLLGQTFLRQ